MAMLSGSSTPSAAEAPAGLSVGCSPDHAPHPCHCPRGSGVQLAPQQAHGHPHTQTIYNAITNGTPCVVVEGSGRVADVIAQVACLPVSAVTVALIQQKLSLFFQDDFETFTENQFIEWTKKVWASRCRGPRVQAPAGLDRGVALSPGWAGDPRRDDGTMGQGCGA